MNYTESEVIELINDQDIKFIRLAFCDIYGTQRNISIMPTELSEAFAHGMPFDASAINGFDIISEYDLLLFPIASTMTILPWRPSHGRVVRFFCEIRYLDGRAFEGDSRLLLKNAVQRASDMGFSCKIGTECEFYLFKTDLSGEATDEPFDNAGYLDIAPKDKGENVRREICFTLEEMGIVPERSHHEKGPGQNEIDFKYSGALVSADNLVSFKDAVRTIASRNGVFASFNPKPIEDKCGNGLHVNLMISKRGVNIFDNENNLISEDAEHFTAGIMKRIQEMTIFLNPVDSSYSRLGKNDAPKYVTWSYQNRAQLIRVSKTINEHSWMELRSPDPMCNAYIGFALILNAGLDGIEEKAILPEAVDLNLNKADKETLDKYETLPESFEAAALLADNSDFINKYVPKIIKDAVLNQTL